MRTPRRFLRRNLLYVTLAALVVSLLVVGGLSLRTTKSAQAAGATSIPVLLLHGFDDSCARFGSGENASPRAYPGPLVQALETQGWAASSLIPIGYYSWDDTNATNTAYDCQYNFVNDSSDVADVQAHCAGLEPNSSVEGTPNEPIRHLGCALAWFIYDKYTAHNLVVDVVAHSMGGLIIRDALGEAGHTANYFPNSLLAVDTVVTLGTPHAGLASNYVTVGGMGSDHLGNTYGNDVQFTDMWYDNSHHSAFIQLLQGIQNPQGKFGTCWTLLGAGVPVQYGQLGPGSNTTDTDGWSLPNPPYNDAFTSYGEELLGSDIYPDGDAVVEASSALAMSAETRILYGGEDVAGLDVVADPSSMYRHGIGCASEGVEVPPHPAFTMTICTHSPYLLDDTSTTNTKGWTCSNCGPDMSSLNIVASSDPSQNGSVAVPRSIAATIQGLNCNTSLPPTPTPSPTRTPVPPTPTATPINGYEGNRNTSNWVGWEATDWSAAQKVTGSWYVPAIPVRNFSDMDTFVGFNGDSNEVGGSNGYFVREGVNVSYDDVGDRGVYAYWEVQDTNGNFIAGNSDFYQPSVSDRVGLTVWYSGTTVNFDFYDQNTNYSVRNTWTAPSTPGFKEYTADWIVTHDEQYLANWNNTGFNMYNCQLSNNGTWYPISFKHYYSDTMAPNGKTLATPGSLYSGNTAFAPTWIIGS